MKSRILVVDDDEMVQTTIVMLLQGLPYEAESVFSGEEAIRRIEAMHFDVICTDFQMPGMNGVELMKHVRERSPDSAVILMTGLVLRDEKLEHAGADAYLQKPFTIDDLRDSLDKALRQKDGRNRSRG